MGYAPPPAAFRSVKSRVYVQVYHSIDLSDRNRHKASICISQSVSHSQNTLRPNSLRRPSDSRSLTLAQFVSPSLPHERDRSPGCSFSCTHELECAGSQEARANRPWLDMHKAKMQARARASRSRDTAHTQRARRFTPQATSTAHATSHSHQEPVTSLSLVPPSQPPRFTLGLCVQHRRHLIH
jgi:hypothetical protein